VPSDLTIRYAARGASSVVRVHPGGLDRLGAFVSRLGGSTRAALVSDSHVAPLHGARAARALRAAGIAVSLHVVPAGERSKRADRLERLWEGLAAAGRPRDGAVVALGGGVVGDLAGFAAATWLRGVRWFGVPTSVLAQVDSSVGGKTGIDLAAGKNLAGAFHQPAGVFVDPHLLATLPVRHRRAGLAEVVKVGFAADAALFRWCERHAAALAAGDPGALAEVVRRAIRAKARIVQADEREREGGVRTALNLGHTLGHAIEAAQGYRGMLHGEAVAVGLRAAARLSEREAGLPARERERLEHLLDALGLPKRLPSLPLRRLLAPMGHDKKRDPRGVRWVLTPRMGSASVPRLISGRLVRAVLLEAGART
jgi:3-dehydroquinate synthase